jgi:hypothetical protein
MIPRVSAIS